MLKWLVHFKVWQLSLVLCSLLLLSSCGFQLRGAYQLPSAMQLTYVKAKAESDLVSALKRQLKASGIALVDVASDQAATLSVYNEQKQSRTVSVDSRGRAREYTLSYQVEFEVKHSPSGFLMEPQSVKIERDFLFDTDDVLGKSKGINELYESMQQDVIRLLLLRLQSRGDT